MDQLSRCVATISNLKPLIRRVCSVIMCLGILFFAFLLIRLFAIKKLFSVFVGEKQDWLLNQEFGLSFARCFLTPLISLA